jgi:hypothetical protein
VALASLSAANVWESKPFNTWTDNELKKVLTSSPWAGKGGMTYVRQQANQQAIQEEALVTWASSRVMRQALAREEYGATADISKEAQTVIAQTPPFYMITVKITKGFNSSAHASRTAEMKNETFLVVKGKPPIPATQAEGQVLDVPGAQPQPPGGAGGGGRGPAFAVGQRGGGGGGGATGGGQSGGVQTGGAPGRSGPTRGGTYTERPTTASMVMFRFPRDPITLADKEVEFVTKLCTGRGGGAPTRGGAPASGASAPPLFELAAPAQQRGGGGAPSGGTVPSGGSIGGQGGSIPGPGVRMGDPLPTCNYQVKKTFKLKNMVVKGELQL